MEEIRFVCAERHVSPEQRVHFAKSTCRDLTQVKSSWQLLLLQLRFAMHLKLLGLTLLIGSYLGVTCRHRWSAMHPGTCKIPFQPITFDLVISDPEVVVDVIMNAVNDDDDDDAESIYFFLFFFSLPLLLVATVAAFVFLYNVRGLVFAPNAVI
jgi:hypothetical protein